MKHFDNTLRRIFSPGVLLWFYPLLLIVPNVALDITEYSTAWSKATNILLPFGFYILIMGIWKNVGRTALLLFPFLFYGAFQVVLLYLYGESIIAVDMFLNLVTTNVSEATELLGNLVGAIITLLIVYVPTLIWCVISAIKRIYASRPSLLRARYCGVVSIFIGLTCMFMAYAFDVRFSINSDIFPVNVIHNTIIAIQRTKATGNYYKTSEGFSYKAHSSRPADKKEVYVLVIGETSRADDWQLFGYGRPTNPLLTKRDGLIAYPKTLSESNTTHKSVPLMLSWVSAENFADSIYTTKSLISAFNEAGFATAYLSNQGRNHSFIDFFAREAQKTVFLTDNGHSHHDEELLPLLHDFIEQSTNSKIMVILHTYGSHFNYMDRYPSSFSVFLPDKTADADVFNRNELINAYDNSIRFTDYVLNRVIDMLENRQCLSGMIYLSDHGEDIFDDKRNRFLHASPVPTYWQIHVPLIIWMSPQFKEAYPMLYANANNNSGKNVSSSRSVFDTMMQLGGIITPYADKTKSLIDSAYTETPRLYLNDHNKAVNLEKAGLQNYDYEMLKQKNIAH
ncbi:MAG: lipid A phosphoethanolamine transferase [Muribaculaceae bacterium]|nr:lipid A phosphoethanolamine transferase [Muribaculaceae bacterium]